MPRYSDDQTDFDLSIQSIPRGGGADREPRYSISVPKAIIERIQALHESTAKPVRWTLYGWVEMTASGSLSFHLSMDSRYHQSQNSRAFRANEMLSTPGLVPQPACISDYATRYECVRCGATVSKSDAETLYDHSPLSAKEISEFVCDDCNSGRRESTDPRSWSVPSDHEQ